MSHSRKKLDLTGQRYGKLTAVAPAENTEGRTAWLCQCDCGKEAVVQTRYLRNGRTSSCGCSHKSPLAKLNYVGGTCVEFLRTRAVRKNNTSGVPGVDWRASKKHWRAVICFKGKRHYLGSYSRFEDRLRPAWRQRLTTLTTFCVNSPRLPPRTLTLIQIFDRREQKITAQEDPSDRPAPLSGTRGNSGLCRLRKTDCKSPAPAL